jgi:hypothetical protein
MVAINNYHEYPLDAVKHFLNISVLIFTITMYDMCYNFSHLKVNLNSFF